MNEYQQLYYQIEQLHVPYENPDCPPDWKDWYHYVLFDPYSLTRILFNISLSGNPATGEIVTTLFINTPSETTADKYGFMNIAEWKSGSVNRMPLHITTPVAEISFNSTKAFIKAGNKEKKLALHFSAKPVATPFLIPEFFPFGNGFVGWGFIPGMNVKGYVEYGNKKTEINDHWFCYHDHNYGRFNWGDDVGWIWWITSLRTEDGKTMTFVFHRGNNKNNTKTGIPYLFVYENNVLQKTFMGNTLRLTIERNKVAVIPVILPGSLASVFNDEHVSSIKTITIRGKDDRDDVQLTMHTEDMLQIILPDYRKKQYSFLMELNGSSSASYTIKGKRTKSIVGNFYAEYVY